MADVTKQPPAAKPLAARLSREQMRDRLLALRATLAKSGVELLCIFLWTLLVAAPYASLNPLTAPRGIEYYTLIQSNHVWTRMAECGACALWNGSVRGGAPAFVDPHASLLHPLVIATTLAFGVIAGSKVALVVIFFLAGVAQWWLARELGLGRAARLWSAGMAVAAGFLAAQMSEGLFSMALSAVSCWLTLPALLRLARTGSRRAAALLGVALGLALVAGQGYMQIGLALILPAALLISRPPGVGWAAMARRYALAGGIALLLAAPFLVPFLHFLPEFTKSGDPAFAAAQPFTYVLFNLVIADHAIYQTDALGKLPFPFLYANYLGWIPVLLALWGLGGGRQGWRLKVFLVVIALISLWAASGTPLRWLANQQLAPGLAGLVAGIRNCSLIAGLAVPPILALAAIGVERLIAAPWLQIDLTMSVARTEPRPLPFDARWLLAFPLTLALLQAQGFGREWIAVEPVPVDLDVAIETLRTPGVEWVNIPIGENLFEQRAVAHGLKLAYGFRAWGWNARSMPRAVLELSRKDVLGDMILQTSALPGINLFAAPPGHEYAAIAHPDGSRTVCAARGADGALDVTCDSPRGGVLTLAENSWDGWQAQVDGAPAPLVDSPLLAVELPPGRHSVSFRYQPWDVPLGLILCFAGALLAIYAWR